MRRTFFLTFIVISSLLKAYGQEEFNGPFPSWANVKERFGAVGNGVADDTRALQTAIDSLSVFTGKTFNTDVRNRYLVIYLPEGRYKISATLHVKGKIGFTIIGQDPNTTVIQWAGPMNGTMLLANGSSYYKISRLSWQSSRVANVEAIGIHWLDKSDQSFAPTSIELSDMIFKGGLAYGIAGGTFGNEGVGANDAEIAIKRCRFYDCTIAGILIKGQNALDYWIWNSTFRNCARGVECRQGNYHVYESSFYGSSVADIDCTDALYSSVRNCSSTGSLYFSRDEGSSCNPFKRIFQHNTVEGIRSIPIVYSSLGKVTLLDNNFLKNASPSKSVLKYSGWCPGNYEVLSLGNYFEDSMPHDMGRDNYRKVIAIKNRNAFFNTRREAIAPAKTAIDDFLPVVNRMVIDVPPGASARQIQAIINKASTMAGKRPVVHFPPGVYHLETEISIPAGSDMQLVGDGIIYGTMFRKKTNAGNDNCFHVYGPSYITITGLNIDAGDYENAFLFTGIDQQGAAVFLDQIYSNADNALYIDGLDYCYFEKNNSFYSSGNIVAGGNAVKSGKGTSMLACFGGQVAGTALYNNAVVVAKDCWWEGRSKQQMIPLDLNGEGRLTVDGAMFAPTDQDSLPVIKITNFKGKINLSDMYVYGGIDINHFLTDLDLLAWNIHFFNKTNPASFVSAGFKPRVALLGATTQCVNKSPFCKDQGIKSVADKTLNVKDVDGFIEDLTSDLRMSMPREQKRKPGNGASFVQISRVAVTCSNNAFRFQQ